MPCHPLAGVLILPRLLHNASLFSNELGFVFMKIMQRVTKVGHRYRVHIWCAVLAMFDRSTNLGCVNKLWTSMYNANKS